MLQYILLHNQDARFGRTGTLDDRYVQGYSGFISESPHSIWETCEAIFQRHNRDDRPDGKTRPSLSMGDIVYFPETHGLFTVDMIGFEQLDGLLPTRVFADYEVIE